MNSVLFIPVETVLVLRVSTLRGSWMSGEILFYSSELSVMEKYEDFNGLPFWLRGYTGCRVHYNYVKLFFDDLLSVLHQVR